MCVNYEQLDAEMIALLRAKVSEMGSIKAVAAHLGVARSAVSQAMDGKYPGGTAKLKAKIEALFCDGLHCPAVGHMIGQQACVSKRQLTMPSGPREAINQWLACRTCQHNPNTQMETAA